MRCADRILKSQIRVCGGSRFFFSKEVRVVRVVLSSGHSGLGGLAGDP